MSSTYEIEIKSLLGEEKEAKRVRDLILEKGGLFINKSKQLNHYFVLNDAGAFKNAVAPFIHTEKNISFDEILTFGKNFSVRTREIFLPEDKNKVILVIKASIGSDTSSNGVSRIEFEQVINMTLEKLDSLLIASGLSWQSKWSREREEYTLNDLTICLDKNAGYGYVAEFEMLGTDESKVEKIKLRLAKITEDFGVVELPQDRLERMFAHYNAHWLEYYGTENVFIIK